MAPEIAAGERKRAAVLFCELLFAGVGEMSSPERDHGSLQSFLRIARAELEPYDAWVQPIPGRGLSAFFGAPVSLEEYPQRCVLAALALHGAMAREPTLEGAQVRMGLDVGSVVVGQGETTIVGAPTRRAEQLQSIARSGEMLISAELAELVGSLVETEVLTEEELKDFAAMSPDSLPPLRLLRLRSQLRQRGGRPSRRSGDFVGRRHELETLQQLARQAATGQGEVVGIAGPGGVGKSRLLQEFAAELRSQEVLHLHTECSAYGGQIPYLPLVPLVRQALGLADAPVDEVELLRSLEERGVGDAETAASTTRFLAVLLKLPGARAGVAGMEPFVIQQKIFEAVRTLLLALSRERFLVLEIEDLHWIDVTSEELLASLVERLSAAPVLLLLSYRPGYRPRWSHLSYSTQIALRRLGEEESREIVDSLIEGNSGAPSPQVAELLAKADGNPLFLIELARSLRQLARQGPSEGQTGSREEPLPDTLQGLLMSRVDRLPAVHKELLRLASVLGQQLDLSLLQSLWRRTEDLLPLLDELQRQEFLAQVPGGQGYGYVFQHALMQEVVYESQLEDERRRLHQQAGTALEELYAERLEAVYDQLVYHFPRAGNPDKTVHYLSRLAAQAVESYAHPEAAAALHEAVFQAENLEEDRDRRILELVLQLCASLFPLARFGETLELLEAHQPRLETVEDRGLEAGFYFWLAHTHSYLGHSEAAVETAHAAIQAARESGDQTIEAKASYVLGRDGFWSGSFASGAEYSQRAVVLLERTGEAWWQGQAHWVAGFNRFALGQVEEALAELQRAQRIGEALDDYRVDPSWSIGYMRAALGDVEAGLEACRQGLASSQDPLNTAAAQGFLGFAHLQNGDFDKARRRLTEAVERMEQAGMPQLEGWFSAYLAEALLAAGKLDAAAAMAQQAIETTSSVGFQFGEAIALRSLATVRMAQERQEEAEELLQRAVEMYRQLGAQFKLGRTLLELAHLFHQTGQDPKAAQAVEEAQTLFAELSVPQFVVKAEELQRELAAYPAPSGQGVTSK